VIVNVPEYLKARRMSIYRLCKLTGIAYSTLHPHVKKGVPLSDRTARKLEKWSKGAMNAAQILGLSPPITGKKRPSRSDHAVEDPPSITGKKRAPSPRVPTIKGGTPKKNRRAA